jgi:membrane protein involved in colicin uptake
MSAINRNHNPSLFNNQNRQNNINVNITNNNQSNSVNNTTLVDNLTSSNNNNENNENNSNAENSNNSNPQIGGSIISNLIGNLYSLITSKLYLNICKLENLKIIFYFLNKK